YSFIPLATKAHGPLHRGSLARAVSPLGAYLGKVIGENESRSATIGSMDHDDRLIGQVDAGIFFGERRVIPGCNFSLKNSCQRLRRELQFATYARYVIGGYDVAQHGGYFLHSGLVLSEWVLVY